MDCYEKRAVAEELNPEVVVKALECLEQLDGKVYSDDDERKADEDEAKRHIKNLINLSRNGIYTAEIMYGYSVIFKQYGLRNCYNTIKDCYTSPRFKDSEAELLHKILSNIREIFNKTLEKEKESFENFQQEALNFDGFLRQISEENPPKMGKINDFFILYHLMLFYLLYKGGVSRGKIINAMNYWNGCIKSFVSDENDFIKIAYGYMLLHRWEDTGLLGYYFAQIQSEREERAARGCPLSELNQGYLDHALGLAKDGKDGGRRLHRDFYIYIVVYIERGNCKYELHPKYNDDDIQQIDDFELLEDLHAVLPNNNSVKRRWELLSNPGAHALWACQNEYFPKGLWEKAYEELKTGAAAVSDEGQKAWIHYYMLLCSFHLDGKKRWDETGLSFYVISEMANRIRKALESGFSTRIKMKDYTEKDGRDIRTFIRDELLGSRLDFVLQIKDTTARKNPSADKFSEALALTVPYREKHEDDYLNCLIMLYAIQMKDERNIPNQSVLSALKEALLERAKSDMDKGDEDIFHRLLEKYEYVRTKKVSKHAQKRESCYQRISGYTHCFEPCVKEICDYVNNAIYQTAQEIAEEADRYSLMLGKLENAPENVKSHSEYQKYTTFLKGMSELSRAEKKTGNIFSECWKEFDELIQNSNNRRIPENFNNVRRNWVALLKCPLTITAVDGKLYESQENEYNFFIDLEAGKTIKELRLLVGDMEYEFSLPANRKECHKVKVNGDGRNGFEIVAEWDGCAKPEVFSFAPPEIVGKFDKDEIYVEYGDILVDKGFVGRDDMLKAFDEGIKDGGKTFILHGFRRIGKTWLSEKLKLKYADKFHVVGSIDTYDGIFGRIKAAMLNCIKDSESRVKEELSWLEIKNIYDFGAFYQRMEELTEKPFMFVFDEFSGFFGKINEHNERLFLNLARGKYEIEENGSVTGAVMRRKPLVLIIDRTDILEKLQHCDNPHVQRLYLDDETQKMHLELWSYDEMKEYIQTQRGSLEFSEDCIKRIYEWTQGSAYYTRTVGVALADALRKEGRTNVLLYDIDRICNNKKMINSVKEMAEHIFKNFNDEEERRILRYLAMENEEKEQPVHKNIINSVTGIPLSKIEDTLNYWVRQDYQQRIICGDKDTGYMFRMRLCQKWAAGLQT